uniref:Uncharacterized protein n=1 Tax=Salix viminalis TaxID=40686 RepID=A0A6N2NAX1_SALVM
MMSASSFTTTVIPCLTISTSPSFPCKTTKLSASCFLLPLKPSSLSTGRVFAASEALDSQTTLDPLPDSETPRHQSVRPLLQMQTSQKNQNQAKIFLGKLMRTPASRYGSARTPMQRPWVPCHYQQEACYCVLKSPHVHRMQGSILRFEPINVSYRFLYPTAQTIDSLMQLEPSCWS